MLTLKFIARHSISVRIYHVFASYMLNVNRCSFPSLGNTTSYILANEVFLSPTAMGRKRRCHSNRLRLEYWSEMLINRRESRMFI